MAEESTGHDLVQAFFAALDLRHLDQCEAVLRQLRGYVRMRPDDKPWLAYCSGILANERDRDWAKAERIFSRLLSTRLAPPMQGRVLLALGRTYDYQGRWAEAIESYEQSVQIFIELGQLVDQAKAWKQIAISYNNGFTQGDFGSSALQQAIAYCQQALDILEIDHEQSLQVDWLKGSIWNTLGLIYRNLAQWNEAIRCYEQDLAICRSLDDRHGIGVSYLNLGEIYQRRGQASWGEALLAYQQALALLRAFDDRYLEADVLANLGFLHQEMGHQERALDYYSQAIEIIEDLRAGVSSEEARAGFFATTVDTYANMVLLCLEMNRVGLAFQYVERARSRAFLDGLAARSLELSRSIEAATMSLGEVQAALPPDTLLIEYFTTGLIEVRGGRETHQGVRRHRSPAAKTLIFAVTPGEIQVYDAGVSPNDLRPAQFNSVVERHFLQLAIRRTLYDRLIAPVAGLLRGQKRVYLAPHGPLHYIPFQALIASDNQTLLRDNGPVLLYTPSATLLLRYGQTMPGRATASCLSLGYNGETNNRLRFGEEEARSIARLTGGNALVGPQPKKEALYSQAQQYRLLHLSCHGAFDPETPLASALHLAPGEALTALDVLKHLHLRCDLVTLSACESGLSRVRRGDELIGFVRAFLYAGAPALICTLWRVDERSTRILMERFYQEVQRGVDFAEALKRAQLYLMQLSRKEVIEVLIHIMADDVLDLSSPAHQPKPPSLAAAVTAAQAYLKSAVAPEADEDIRAPSGDADDERIFADPYYWAPFVIIGDHQLG